MSKGIGYLRNFREEEEQTRTSANRKEQIVMIGKRALTEGIDNAIREITSLPLENP